MEKSELINVVKSPIVNNFLSTIDFKWQIKNILNTYIQIIKEPSDNSINNLLAKLKQLFWWNIPDEIKTNILKVSISSRILCQKIPSYEDYKILLNNNINIFALIKEVLINTNNIWIKENFINELIYTLLKIWEIYLRDNMLTISSDEQKVIQKKQIWKSENIIIKVEYSSLDDNPVLLRNKIWIEDYKKKLQILRKNWNNQNKISQLEFEATNKIIKCIHEYPYQMSKDNWWFKVENILNKKEIFCLWYCILWYSYLEELGIETQWINELRHISLLINIWNNEYYFDPFKYNSIKDIYWENNIWKYREFNIEWINNVWITWDTKDVLLSYIFTYKWIDLDEEWKFYESIESYKKAIEIDWYNAFTINNLWISYQNIWDFDNALKLYNKAITLYPNFSIAYSDIWELLLKQGKHIEAIKYFEKALGTKDLYSSEYYSSSILTNIWFSYYKLWKYKDAIYYLNLAINNTPNYSKSYKHIWRILIKLWNYDIWNIYTDIFLKLENNTYKINNNEINKLIESKEFDKLLKVLKLYNI